MSISTLIQGQRKTTGTDLATTAATQVFTAQTGQRDLVLGVSIANKDTVSAVTAKIEFNDGSTDFVFIQEVSLPAKGRQEYDFPFAFINGGSIKVTAGTANKLHVLVTSISTIGPNV